MAFWIAFDVKTNRGSHPLDPDDFDRCLRLLEYVPEMRPHLHRMKEVSYVWAALVERWEEIERSHLDEVGLSWTKAGSAPKTYELMQSIIGPLEHSV